MFTCNWSTPPYLFYGNHRNRYLVFLDPTYMVLWNEDKWKLWTAFTQGNIVQTPSYLLNKGFSTEWGFCEAHYKRLRELLVADPRVAIVFEDEDGFTFRARPPAE